MSWAGTEPFDLYLGSRQAGLAKGGEPLGWAEHDGLAAATVHWASVASGSQRRGLRRPAMRVWLSGALARPFLCGPVQGLKRWGEAELLAQATVSEATGLDGPCEVVLEDWPGNAAAMAVASPADGIASIVAAVRDAKCRVLSLRPWWTGALHRALQDHRDARMLVAVESDAVTILSGQHGRWDSASTFAPAPPAPQLEQLLARKLMATAIGAELRVLAQADASALGGAMWPAVRLTVGETSS